MGRHHAALLLFISSTFLVSLNSFLIAETPADSALAKRITVLESKLDSLEQIVKIPKQENDKFFDLYKSKITQETKSIDIINLLLTAAIILISLLGLTGLALYKKLYSRLKSDLTTKLEMEIESKTSEEISNHREEIYKELQTLGVDPPHLGRELLNLLNDRDIILNMLGLQSSLAEQKKAIAYFIEKPAEGNPLVLHLLESLKDSVDPEILAQYMLARYRCCDSEKALADLEALKKHENPAMREAAEKALKEIEENPKQVQ